MRSSSGFHRAFVEPGKTGIFEYAFPPVRYGNRRLGGEANASRNGWYYISVFALADATADAAPGDLVTVELGVARNGEPEAGPAYTTSDASATADPSAQDTSAATAAPSADDGSTAPGADDTQPSDSTETSAAPQEEAGTPAYLTWLVAGSAVVLLAAGGALWGLLRRRG